VDEIYVESDCEEVLKIADPKTGAIRFRITDMAIEDHRPHDHKYGDRAVCLICGKTKKQVEEESNDQAPSND
jgi:hypothetical protein